MRLNFQRVYILLRCIFKVDLTILTFAMMMKLWPLLFLALAASHVEDNVPQHGLSRRKLMFELIEAKDRLDRLQELQDLTRTWLDDEWVLAFRISSGIGQMAYEAFYNTGAGGSPLANVCGQHYRNSKLLDNWPSELIDTVRVSVRVNGTEQAFITFNGRGKTFDSWFAKDNVVSSSWTDLQSQTANIFSIAGHLIPTSPSIRRRFFVNHLYNDCPGDQGWLVVLDGQEGCHFAWPRVPANFNVPLILYSKRRHLATFSSAADVGVADELLILVKFRDVLDCAGACVTTR